MSASRVFDTPYKNLSSSEKIQMKKAKTMYNFTYCNLKNKNPKNTNYGPIYVNEKTHCLKGANNAENLLLITKGKYLADPYPNINLDGGNINYGNFLYFSNAGLKNTLDTKIQWLSQNNPSGILTEPDVQYNTFVYPPPPAYAGIPYPDTRPENNNFWTGMLIVDPCGNVFKSNNNCNKNTESQFFNHVEISGVDTYLFKSYQQGNYLQGMNYPSKFMFTKPKD